MFQKVSMEKNYGLEAGGGGITFFRRNFFVSVPKNFVGVPFILRNVQVSKIFLDKRERGVSCRVTFYFEKRSGIEKIFG